MIRLNRAAAVVLSTLAAACLFPVSAEAQLGGLARRARQALEDKAEDALPFTPLPAPEFNDRLLEITPALAARMLEAFDAEISYAAKAGEEYEDRAAAHERALADYDQALAAYQKTNEAYSMCRDEFLAKEAETSAENEARVGKVLEEMSDDEFDAYMEDLAERGEKIALEVEANSGRMDPAMRQRHEAFQREIAAMLVEQNRRMTIVVSGQIAESRRQATENPRLVEACGKEPVSPAQPRSELTGPESVLAEVGSRKAGMRADQYAIMRERVLYWSAEGGRPSGMGFSAGEMSALGAVQAELEGLVKRMSQAKVPL